MRVAACLCTTMALAGQEAYFKETPASAWVPAWELTLRGDRIDVPEEGRRLLERSSVRLRLRWTWEEGPWSAALGSWSALGSDPNRLNVERYDQQPSNGTRLDAAWVQARGASDLGFVELRLGHQENPLLSQESLWDKDLRITGATLRAAFRGESLQELGVRATAGRVATLQDGNVVLAAAQAVVRVDTGPLTWTAHAGRWRLRWDATAHRERGLPGSTDLRPELAQDVLGAAVTWHGVLPVELKAIRHRDPDTKQEGAEFQAWLGSRNRPWWPQVGYVWQRFEARGTFTPLNGDDWWFIANARGPRYEAALPLPRKWLLVATYLRHRSTLPWTYPVDRRLLQLVKRF